MSAAVLPAPGAARPPLTRLARVELRKLRDTRSGFWLLLSTLGLLAVVVIIVAIASEPADRTFADFATAALFPTGVLLPVVAILAVTSEFSQRTALQTFTAVPQRSRVLVAKALAILALGVAGTVAGVAIAAIVNAVTPAFGDADGSWAFGLDGFGQALLYEELTLLIGLGFGMLFASPAVAIVVYFALPTVFAGITAAFDSLRDLREWVDTSVAWTPLSEFTTNGGEWAKVLVSSGVWVGIPLLLGALLLSRREVS